MLRKVFLAIECANEEQHAAAQKILNEVSNTRVITAERLIKAYPMYKQRENEIRQLFGLVSSNGIKGLMSAQGVSVLTKLIKK